MIRIFYLKIRFLRRVNDFFDLQKKAILTNSFRSVPSLLRIDFCKFQVTYIDFKDVTPGVHFRIFFYENHLTHTIF